MVDAARDGSSDLRCLVVFANITASVNFSRRYVHVYSKYVQY